MKTATEKVGFGGSCHWCTEAIFQSLRGVVSVQQGWICSSAPNDSESEAVVVVFDPAKISLVVLIQIHLHTHSCTSDHSMRTKYRSAVYTFDAEQTSATNDAIAGSQKNFDEPIITQVMPFSSFRSNDESFLDYYYKNPEKAFCNANIDPKLLQLMDKFKAQIEVSKLEHLQSHSQSGFVD